MLFLAVFCGLLAEYQLEHTIEKDREKQYMKSLVEDLKTDTASMNILIPALAEKHKTYDSLTHSVLEKKYMANGSDFYYWARIISRSYEFTSTDGTIQQLKYSGGLRRVHNKAVTDSIMSYDIYYRGILKSQALVDASLSDYRNIASKIFEAQIFNKMFKTNVGNDLTRESSIIYMGKPAGNPQLRKNSEDLIYELMNRAMYWYTASVSLINDFKTLNKKAENLIKLIKKEYRINP